MGKAEAESMSQRALILKEQDRREREETQREQGGWGEKSIMKAKGTQLSEMKKNEQDYRPTRRPARQTGKCSFDLTVMKPPVNVIGSGRSWQL